MAWNFLSKKAVVSSRKGLQEARKSLIVSMAQPSERREEFRLFHPTVGTVESAKGEMLLNVSRSGVAVGVRNRCTFARGERYRITLNDGTTQTDLEGQVCWTRSAWPRGVVEAAENEYFQAAGLVFAEPLSNDQKERWKALRELVQDGSGALGMTISPAKESS